MSTFSNISGLFPTKMSACIFFAYIALFVTQGMLVTASKEKDAKYAYSTVTVVMLIEFLKLTVCASLYIAEFSVLQLFAAAVKGWKVLLLYFVPSLLYSLYNNLTFVNLSVFDPTTYYLLMQIRVVVTGILFQVLFRRQLSRKQWISLILLTVGCAVKQLHSVPSVPTANAAPYFLLIFVQVLCSCFAGVYNEYLLKDSDVHFMLQNVFMYVDCIVCNGCVLIASGQASTFSLSPLRSPLVVCVVVNGALCGICTALFLRQLDSILKTFAAALDLIFTAAAARILFSIPLDIYTLISISIVLLATHIYAQNPVVNNHKEERQQNDNKV